MNEEVHTPTDTEIVQEARGALKELISVNSSSVAEPTCFVGIFARATRPSPRMLRKLEMETTLAERMRNTALDPLSKGPQWLDDLLLRPFDQRGTQEEDIRCLIVKETPAVQEWIDALPHRDTWEIFSRDEWEQKKISGVFFEIVFPGHNERLVAFSCWSDALLLKRKGWVATLSRSRYSLEESESLIYLPQSIDFFFYKGVLFALKWKNFESAVNFRDISRQRAEELWTTFISTIPIAQSEAVWKVISKSVRTQNTIIKALTHPDRCRASLGKIEEFIRERKLKVRVENGALHIDPKDKDQVEQLITIMADGFVTSDLTSQRLITLDAVPAVF